MTMKFVPTVNSEDYRIPEMDVIRERLFSTIERSAYARAEYIEKILEQILKETPDLKIDDLEIHFTTDHEPIAIYKRVKIYDFEENKGD